MTMTNKANTLYLLLSFGSTIVLLLLFLYQLILMNFSTAELLLYFAGSTLVLSIIQYISRKNTFILFIKYFLAIAIISYYVFVYICLAVPTYETKWVVYQSVLTLSFLFTFILMIIEIKSTHIKT